VRDRIEFKQRQCKVVLTDEQLREQADIMATRAQLLEDIEAEKKSMNASFKERLERVSGEIRTAARLYKDGYDWRDVECAVVKDWEFGEVLYIRVDTCELAHVENMSQSERQMRIDDIIDEKNSRVAAREDAAEKEEGKTDEEIRRERAISRLMSSEKSSVN
jgi:hypothetical protein